jgi:hypothetical protein
MSKEDWITGKDGWPIDPNADPNCSECNGTGVLVIYPFPSGMQEVLIGCECCK